MNRPRHPPHQQQQHQGWFDIHGRPPPPSPFPSPRPHSLNNIHGQPAPLSSPSPSPRPHSRNNVNIHHHHYHHHHNLPQPLQSSWHVPLASPYQHHHQYYPSAYGHPLPPFPIQNYPNYYGGGGGSGGGAAAVQEAIAQPSCQTVGCTTSATTPETTPTEGVPNRPARHPYTMPDWEPKTKQELRDSIRYQIEFYFSVENLFDDMYLRNNMDEEGWVSVDVIAMFPQIKRKCRVIDLILESLKPSLVVEVQGNKMRRKGDWSRWIVKHD